MSQLEKIESLLLREFKTVPFHNIFMLENKNIIGSSLGGTCSDKVLHFRKVLFENNIESKLHAAFINGHECHRMLITIIDNEKYFMDIGSGWPSIKLFPVNRPIEYSIYGMSFKTQIMDDFIELHHKKTNSEYKVMITIPFKEKKEDDILQQIHKRYKDKSIYPFENSLRFSLIHNDSFYFIKGNCLRVFNDNSIIESELTKEEAFELIRNEFEFKLELALGETVNKTF